MRHPVFRHQLPTERKTSERESENDGQPLIFFARQGKKVLNMRPLVEKKSLKENGKSLNLFNDKRIVFENSKHMHNVTTVIEFFLRLRYLYKTCVSWDNSQKPTQI